jgi:hypothetical protein
VWLIRGRAAKAEGQNAQTQCVRGHISAKGREAMRNSAIVPLFDANLAAGDEWKVRLDYGIDTDLSEVWTSGDGNDADGRVPILL